MFPHAGFHSRQSSHLHLPPPSNGDKHSCRDSGAFRPRYDPVLRNPHHALSPSALGSLRYGVPADNHDSDFISARGGSQLHYASQHMLRRKTPNGTLAAGYDGSGVQWSSAKLPAAKHVVLPSRGPHPPNDVPGMSADAGTQYGPSGRLSSTSQDQMLDCYPNYSQLPDNTTWHHSPAVSRAYNAEAGYMPSYSHPQFSSTTLRVPIVDQPSYQSFPGPTVSEDGGFYGPYWPDGSYVPYRPAATRESDYRQYPQQSLDNFDNLKNNLQYDSLVAFGGGQHNVEGLSADHSRASTYVQRQGNHLLDTTNYHHLFDLRDRDPSSDGRYHVSEGPQSQGPALESYGSMIPTLHPSTHTYRMHSKEKALSWAHRMYVQLLACLQQTPKSEGRNDKRGHRLMTKNSLYPKPPRQPASAFGGFDLTGTSGPNATLLSPHRTEESQINVSSALANAQTALDMLQTLCEESEWKWIDGMLLGGCLAYGLEHYGVAHDWYSKIVRLDPKFVPIPAAWYSYSQNIAMLKLFRILLRLSCP